MGRKNRNAGQRASGTSADAFQHLAGPRRPRAEPVIFVGRRACSACGLALPEDWQHDLHAACWRRQNGIDSSNPERTNA